jgi:ion channel
MRWHVGPVLRRLQASRSYGFVLLLVLSSFAFVAAAPDEGWPRAVLVLIQATTLAVALWTSAATGRLDAIAAALVVIGIAGAGAELATDSSNATGLVGLLNVLLITATCAVIVLGIRDQHGVNVQSVLGALCIYLLIGMLYTFAYGAISALQSGPFFAQGTEGTPSIRLYFSVVTLATVGYGDYSATTDLGRTVAASEGLLGQIYLVTVVAVIVSRLRPARSERPSEQ